MLIWVDERNYIQHVLDGRFEDTHKRIISAGTVEELTANLKENPDRPYKFNRSGFIQEIQNTTPKELPSQGGNILFRNVVRYESKSQKVVSDYQ